MLSSRGAGFESNPQPLQASTEIKLSYFQNFWTRNSRAGKAFFGLLAIQFGCSVLLICWAGDAALTGQDFSDFLDNYYLDSVTNIDIGNAERFINLMSAFISASAIILGVLGLITWGWGFGALATQGRTTFTIYGLFAGTLCACEVIFGILTITLCCTFLNKKPQFQDLCLVLINGDVRTQCSSQLDQEFTNLGIQLLGPSVLLLFHGLLMAGMTAVSMIAKLNAPQNLVKLRKREVQAARMLQLMRDRDKERQTEQRKIQHAFRLLDAFQMVDLDASGTIEASELNAVMHALKYDFTEQEIQQIIRDADVDGDGKLDYQEFIRMMMSSENGMMQRLLEAEDHDNKVMGKK